MNTEYKNAIATFKTDIKAVGTFTSQYKKAFKEWQRTGSKADIESACKTWESVSKSINLNHTYPDYDILAVKSHARYMHIAYSLAKGNSLSAIEKTEKSRNVDRLKEIIKKYTNSDELINSIDFEEKNGLISSIFSKIKEVCHG